IHKKFLSILALIPLDNRCGIVTYELRSFTEAFITSSPAVIPYNGHRRSIGPVLPCCIDFDRGYLCDFANQLWITCRAQANVVRKNCGGKAVIMPMHCIDA